MHNNTVRAQQFHGFTLLISVNMLSYRFYNEFIYFLSELFVNARTYLASAYFSPEETPL